MRLSWGEVLGLLIVLGVLYGGFSYALATVSQSREEAASKRVLKEEDSRPNEAQQQTTSTDAEGEMAKKEVTVRVTGPSGERFGGNVGNLRSYRAVEGVVPTDYRVEVHTDPSSGDHVYATVWKTAQNDKELKVQIIDGGRVVKEGHTIKDNDAASVRWDPNERQSSEPTVPSNEKKKTG